jgi:hypothetical protein
MMLAWIERTAVASAMREWAWLYPAIEILHIVGIVGVVGSVAMFDLRVLGVSPRLPLDRAAAHLLPCSIASLLLVVPSGLLLFASDATAVWGNIAFRAKIALLAAAGINAFLFRRFFLDSIGRRRNDRPPVGAKVSAAVSLLIWGCVIACGRLIAYL